MEATATAATVPVPEWLLYFEAWLLSLLNRLCGTERSWADGDGYPLASLKQDFRFQTGLEIDHQALGFDNLSEFIASLYSHLCTLETVGGARNRRLIVRPIKAPTRLISPAIEAYCVVFSLSQSVCALFTSLTTFIGLSRRPVVIVSLISARS